LQSYENPAYGGWGARFGVASNTVWKKNETVYNKNQGLVISITRKLAKGEVTDNITLNGSDTNTLTFTVPKDAKSGDTIHLIAQVQDNGKFTLKHYKSVIITVK